MNLVTFSKVISYNIHMKYKKNYRLLESVFYELLYNW